MTSDIFAFIFLYWIALVVMVPYIAQNRGRSAFAFFMFSIIVNPVLALIYMLCTTKEK